MTALRELFRQKGYYERPLGPVLLAMAGHLVLAFGGMAGCVLVASWWLKALLMTVSCFGFIGLGTHGHTASHNAAADESLVNRALYYLTFPVMLHLSACYWRYSHIQIHHPQPNVAGLDDDCDLRPVFAVNQQHLAEVNPVFRRWPWLQGVVLPVALPLTAFNMFRQSWLRLFRELLDSERRGAEQWIDLACLVAHLGLFVGLPMIWFAPGDVALFWVVRQVGIGVGIFGVLAPGHYPAPVLSQRLRQSGDFYFRQAACSVNFRTGPIGRFLCAGLEYQIEHHMFPSISHVHLRAIAPYVEQYCREQGIPHVTLGWAQAVWRCWYVFFVPKPVVTDIAELRLHFPELREAA